MVDIFRREQVTMQLKDFIIQKLVKFWVFLGNLGDSVIHRLAIHELPSQPQLFQRKTLHSGLVRYQACVLDTGLAGI